MIVLHAMIIVMKVWSEIQHCRESSKFAGMQFCEADANKSRWGSQALLFHQQGAVVCLSHNFVNYDFFE